MCYITDCLEILECVRCVDRIVPTSRYLEVFYRLLKTDLLYDLRNTIEQEKEISGIDLFCQIAQVKPSSPKIPLWIPDRDRRWAQRLLGKGDKITIVIQVDSGARNRCIPQDTVLKLVEILKKNYRVVLMGRGKNVTLPDRNVIDLQGKSESLKRAMAVLERCDLLICPDSSFLHIAGMLDIPTLAIFSIVPPELRAHDYRFCHPIVPEIECHPCFDHTGGCRRSDFLCLRGIKPEDIASKADEIISGL